VTVGFRDAFPILLVADVERSLGFYRDLLGFEVVYCFPSEHEPQFVSLTIDGGKLALGATEAEVQSASAAIWVYADDVDDAVAVLREAGVRVTAEPADQPWGERVASVADPDGFTVHIGARSA
jgi:lactoylglutathione lyase